MSTAIYAQDCNDWVYRNGIIEIEDFSFNHPTTDNNMSVIFPSGTMSDFVGGSIKPFVYGNPVSNYESNISDDGSVGIVVWGTDRNINCELAYNSEEIQFAILVNEETIINVSVEPPIIYAAANTVLIADYYLSFSIGNSPVIFGCTDIAYLEYNSSANIDDESCSTLRVDGCTDSSSCVYNPDANYDDGSCIYESPQSDFNTCCLNNLITSICPSQVDCDAIEIDCVNPGCMSDWADNFDPFATQDDGSCYRYGCTSDWADNYDSISTIDDGSCYRMGCSSEWADNFDTLATDGDASCYLYGCSLTWADNYNSNVTHNDGSCFRNGCKQIWADNFDSLATIDDGSCYRDGCTYSTAYNYDELATINDGSCLFNVGSDVLIDSLSIMNLALNQALKNWNTKIDLAAGWNMFGYGCPAPIDLVQAMSEHTDNIIILKDNNGKAYMPEFGFNGIGDLTPGLGYQIKVTEAIEGFSLCDWYVNDIPEDNIVLLQEENASMKAELDSLYGCMDEGACNFDPTAVLNDSSCDYETCLDECGVVNGDNTTCLDCEGVPNGTAEDLGCGCGNPAAQVGYDCEGNEIITYQVGDLAHGGIVFYVDETGQHGLVAALEDIEGTYEWGCFKENVNGADGTSIGTGYQNTLDIVNQECSTVNGGITAAQAALDAEINGYSYWYLPSKDELIEMYNTIGNGGSEGNIGGFVNGRYWSSSERSSYSAWRVYFNDGNANFNYKVSTFRVRVIRAF